MKWLPRILVSSIYRQRFTSDRIEKCCPADWRLQTFHCWHFNCCQAAIWSLEADVSHLWSTQTCLVSLRVFCLNAAVVRAEIPSKQVLSLASFFLHVLSIFFEDWVDCLSLDWSAESNIRCRFWAERVNATKRRKKTTNIGQCGRDFLFIIWPMKESPLKKPCIIPFPRR